MPGLFVGMRPAAAAMIVATGMGMVAACRRPVSAPANADADAKAEAEADADADANAGAGAEARADAGARADAVEREHGPFEVPFERARKVYYVVPRKKGIGRLIGNLHGVCNPPGYSCGYWVEAASALGFLVCPEGNSRCGGPTGPTTWTEPVAKIDADLEKAITVVDGTYPGEMTREGSVLTAFSLGAYTAVQIAKNHPGRWPYLVLNEADVALDVASLRASGVRAVALIAGENGSQVAGERRTAEKLSKQGFPARLWVMKGAGHYYSADIDTIMAEAIGFVLSEGDAGAPR